MKESIRTRIREAINDSIEFSPHKISSITMDTEACVKLLEELYREGCLWNNDDCINIKRDLTIYKEIASSIKRRCEKMIVLGYNVRVKQEGSIELNYDLTGE